jgi:hypothetical protein
MPTRTPDHFIDHFVSLVLSHIDREYPNKLDHVINDEGQVKSPRRLHPVFYGSFDWHSSVHGHWLLVRALRLFPNLAQADEVRDLLTRRFTDAAVAAEVAYLGEKRRETFERPYGWGWFLKLAAEIRAATRDEKNPGVAAASQKWLATLTPLIDAFVARMMTFLPKATYPIRVGTHHNWAFALALSLDYAVHHKPLDETIRAKARSWYFRDENYPAWEPDGSDFLSPGLCEAECMRRALPESEVLPWFDRFFPRLADRKPETLFTPAIVSDRTDGHITHLDGLNLSRAWCWRSLAKRLPAGDARRKHAEEAYQVHLDAALPHVTGDYVGEHWLATFALLAMTE